MHALTSSFETELTFVLNDLTIVSVTGQDAENFLQGQMTCDVRALSPKQASMGACCNAKGQVISNFIILRQDTEFLLIVPADSAALLISKLKRYVLRSKVQFNYPAADWQIKGFNLAKLHQQGLSNSAHGLTQRDQGYWLKWPDTSNRFLWIGRESAPIDELPEGTPESWAYADISHKIPWISPQLSERFTPQMLNLDQLGAISFSKGCYTGQEIVARTHYLGKAKRTLYVADCARVIEEPISTLNVLCANSQQNLGSIIAMQKTASGCRFLLVLSIIEESQNPLTLDDPARTPLTICHE